jgi:hypothetical protein
MDQTMVPEVQSTANSRDHKASATASVATTAVSFQDSMAHRVSFPDSKASLVILTRMTMMDRERALSLKAQLLLARE